MSTASIIVKKQRLVKKNFFRIYWFFKVFSTFPQAKLWKKFFSKAYFETLRDLVYYILYLRIQNTRFSNGKRFFQQLFSLNLWITFDILMTVMSILRFHRFHNDKYYVIHKLLTNLWITQKNPCKHCWNKEGYTPPIPEKSRVSACGDSVQKDF